MKRKLATKNFLEEKLFSNHKQRPNLRMLARIYIDPNEPILYSLQVIAEDGNLDFPEAQTFLDSFVVF